MPSANGAARFMTFTMRVFPRWPMRACCACRLRLGCSTNYHLFFILLPDRDTRNGLLSHLKDNGIRATFHYVPLHSSPMGRKFGYKESDLPLTEELSARLLRLPFFNDINEIEQSLVIGQVTAFLRKR